MTQIMPLLNIIVVFILFVGTQAQNNATHRKFPEGFLFGAATAAYQVEGAWNVSDKGENIWDRLSHTTNLIKGGSTGDVACDSYHQYARDVEMLKELGVNFYRFSLSWSRILPTGFSNKISTDGIAYYNKLINLLIDNNITPVVTLYHWDLPQPLQDIGGLPNPLLENYFTDFARVAFDAFGDRVTEWLTFNEPFEICQGGYGIDKRAPALNFSGIADYLCAHTLIKAHARVFHLYDDVYRKTQKGRIGMTLSIDWHEPENANSTADQEASENALQFQAGWYAHPIYSEEGDYPAVFKQKIAQRSAEQGFSSSRLPAFTPEEVEYIKGTYDFLGMNQYTSKLATPAQSYQYPSPSFDDDLGVYEYQSADWPSSPASNWLKVRRIGMTLSIDWHEPENANSTADQEASENALQFQAGWYAHPIYSEEGDYPAVFKQKIAQRSAEQGFSSSRLPAFTPEEVEYIKGTYDFLGMNQYTSKLATPAQSYQYPSPSFDDDLGVYEYQSADWPSSPASNWLKVVPWGFKNALVWLKNQYNDPEIIVFENGYSDLGGTNDTGRISYYKQYLNAMLDAMEEGVTITAYTAWSLMDNMEWRDAYTEKFGLFEVDFNNASRPRTAKTSANYYREIIKTKTIERILIL